MLTKTIISLLLIIILTNSVRITPYNHEYDHLDPSNGHKLITNYHTRLSEIFDHDLNQHERAPSMPV